MMTGKIIRPDKPNKPNNNSKKQIKKPPHVTKTYVRKELRRAYHYSFFDKNGKNIEHKRLQPEIRTIKKDQEFLVITPYHNTAHTRITYILKWDWKFGEYHFVTNLLNPYSKKLLKIKSFRGYVNSLLATYQLGRARMGVYYIPIIDYNIEGAYYRMNHFTMAYSSVAHYILGI